MYPYTELMTKTFILLLLVSYVKGACYDNSIRCCNVANCTSSHQQCPWSFETWTLNSYSYYYTWLSHTTGKMKSSVYSSMLCSTDRQYCLTFHYRARHDVDWTVYLQSQASYETQSWTVQRSENNRWSNASVPISHKNTTFYISIRASVRSAKRDCEVNLGNIRVYAGNSCPTKPDRSKLTIITWTVQPRTFSTTKTATSTSTPSPSIATKTTIKETLTSTTSLHGTISSLLTTVNNSRHHIPAVSDAEKSEVTSPVTVVAVSVTVVILGIVVVTSIVFSKRRQVRLCIKRLGSRTHHTDAYRKPDISVDLADIGYSMSPSVISSAVNKKPHYASQSQDDNAVAVASSSDVTVYQNIPSSHIINSKDNNDYVNEPSDPHLYNIAKDCDQTNEGFVGIYHVITKDPKKDVRMETPPDNDNIYSVAQKKDMASEGKADNSDYNALNLPGRTAVVPRDSGSHDVYNHLTEEDGAYSHVNATRTNDVIDDEYSHIQSDDPSSET